MVCLLVLRTFPYFNQLAGHGFIMPCPNYKDCYMNIRNLFFSLLSVFLIACGSGSSSDSEQSQKNSTLYLLNNATYMAVRYNEDSWKQIEDNQTVSIQLANQSDVVSVIYS